MPIYVHKNDTQCEYLPGDFVLYHTDWNDWWTYEKRFYIGDMEYKTIEDFAQALLRLFPDGVVPVFTIDGLHPKHTVWGRPLKS